MALLAACTIPALMKFGRGAWIQYRAYTLTLWSGVVLTFPHFMNDSMFAHRSAHNPWAMLILSAAALVANVWVFAARLSTTPEKAGFTSASEGEISLQHARGRFPLRFPHALTRPGLGCTVTCTTVRMG